MDLLRMSGIIPVEHVVEEFPRVLTQVTQNLERLHRQGEISDGALFIFGFSMMWKALEDLPPAARVAKFKEMAQLFDQSSSGGSDDQGGGGGAAAVAGRSDGGEQAGEAQGSGHQQGGSGSG
jgi:hypothetical protein